MRRFAYFNLQPEEIRGKGVEELAEKFGKTRLFVCSEALANIPESVEVLRRAVPDCELLAYENSIIWYPPLWGGAYYEEKAKLIAEKDLLPFSVWSDHKARPAPSYLLTERTIEKLLEFRRRVTFSVFDGTYLDHCWDRFPSWVRNRMTRSSPYWDIDRFELDFVDGRRLYTAMHRALEPNRTIIGNGRKDGPIDPSMNGLCLEGIGTWRVSVLQARSLVARYREFARDPITFVGWVTKPESRAAVESIADWGAEFHVGESHMWPY